MPVAEAIAGMAAQIRAFIAAAGKPMLVEPGAAPFALADGCFELMERGNRLALHVWSGNANMSRRIVSVDATRRGELALKIELFGGKTGTLTIYDAERPTTRNHGRRGERLELRERFRRFLRRQYPDCRLADLSTEQNLEASLSPNFPRAFLKHGTSSWAAIAAPAEPNTVDEVLSFGLIWLDYLRRREARRNVEGLILYLPAGMQGATCLRLQYLSGAKWRAWAYAEEGFETPLDLADYGNLDTSIARCRRPIANDLAIDVAGVERLEAPDGTVRIRVRGLEIARVGDEGLVATFDGCTPYRTSVEEVTNLAHNVARVRAPDSADRHHPLYRRDPELWLESSVRECIEEIDATLRPAPLYGQVPGITGTAHGIIDLLACDRDGRLAILELKASEDIHLPLQALDYWMRVKWHVERGDFARQGYFPALSIRTDAPRLLLVAPATQFHPTNESVLRWFSPEVAVERVGVGIEWHNKLKVMLRA